MARGKRRRRRRWGRIREKIMGCGVRCKKWGSEEALVRVWGCEGVDCSNRPWCVWTQTCSSGQRYFWSSDWSMWWKACNSGWPGNTTAAAVINCSQHKQQLPVHSNLLCEPSGKVDGILQVHSIPRYATRDRPLSSIPEYANNQTNMTCTQANIVCSISFNVTLSWCSRKHQKVNFCSYQIQVL